MKDDLNERQEEILDIINRNGEGRVNDFKSRFGVTDMTIRRDLEKLEQKGLLRRTFGGAIPIAHDITLGERNSVFMNEKMKIGKMAANKVKEGEAIFIDAGSTTFQVARYLNPDLNITVVTNALNVASELLEKEFHTVVVGGILAESTASLMGPIAMDTIRKMAFDRIFLGATGMTAEHGFSNSNVLESEVKKMAIQKASEVNIVLDHSKFGIQQLVSFAELSDVDYIITDQMPDNELAYKCTELGVVFIVGE